MRKLTFFIAILLFAGIAFSQVQPSTATDRLKKIEQRKALQQQSLVNHIAFRNIGPTVMSGRVSDVEVNPEDPTEMYVAYSSGGLWHSINNGQSFTSIFDSEDILTIGDIAVNWSEGKNRSIWIGTGEVNSSRSSYAGIGIYKSNNNGKSWEYLGLPESHHIGKIQLHPTNPNIAWVAALGHLYSPNKERGVYKTTDAGKTWKHTLVVDENTGAVEMEINPQNPNELFAAMWYRTRTAWNFEESGKSSGLYKSIDGGDTWQLISKEGSGLPFGDGLGRMGIAIHPQKANIVYVVVDNQAKKPEGEKKKDETTAFTLRSLKAVTTKEQFASLDEKKLDSFLKANRFPAEYNAATIKQKVSAGDFKPSVVYDYLKGPNDDLLDASAIIGCEIYKSEDGGKTFKKVNTSSLDNMYSTYGYYFGKIFVSSQNENKVIITGVPVMLSEDGGKTFKSIGGPGVHSDHHSIWINPKKDSHIINGNDGGINITYDNGENWFKANSIPVGQFYSVFVDDAKPYNVYGGLQDNGVWYFPSVTPSNRFANSGLGITEGSTTNIGGGDGMQVVVDTRDNSTYYAGSQFGNYVRNNKTNTARLFIRPRHNVGETPLRYNWETPILLSKHNQDVFYMGSNRVHRSLNKAENMQNLSTDLTKGGKPGDVPFGTLSCLVESPMKFGLLYSGSDDGLLHISKDGGYNWTRIAGTTTVSTTNKKGKTETTTTNVLPQDLWVSSIQASAFKEGRVYASFNGYRNDLFTSLVYMSDDYGANWKQIGTDLPIEPVNIIKEDNKDENIIYVGTDGGLYVSINKGTSFMAWNKGMPKSVPVHDIAIQNRENEIVVATHGRSIYIAKLDDVQKLLKDPAFKTKKEEELKNKK